MMRITWAERLRFEVLATTAEMNSSSGSWTWFGNIVRFTYRSSEASLWSDIAN